MSTKEVAMFKALCSHFHKQDRLLSYLPEDEREKVQRAPHPQSLDFSALLDSGHWLTNIHYSWLKEPMNQLTEEMHPLFLSMLPKEMCTKMGHEPPERRVPLFARNFISAQIREQLVPDSILPEELLGGSDVNILLELTRQERVHVVDLLGIHDLAADLRQIVDKQLLEKVYSALTQEQIQFLGYASKQPAKWVSPKLGLPGWDGNKKTLNTLLHKRGLHRLAKGISDETPSFKWHLIHHLDVGRGKIVLHVLSEPQEAHLVAYFKKQILHIAKRYR